MASEDLDDVQLTNLSEGYIQNASLEDILRLSESVDIEDPNSRLESTNDVRERLVLIRRKQKGMSHMWKHHFRYVFDDSKVKITSLMEIMATLRKTFSRINTDVLSEILMEEECLRQPNLLREIDDRLQTLLHKETQVVVTGETNGGKSSFLNLLLEQDILPIDVLHCTFSICKIRYAETYSVSTLAFDGTVTNYSCDCMEQAREILKSKITESDMKVRSSGPLLKEVTLEMPADILKSGITLVDTPGIGEDEAMDDITMNYVQNTQIAAFVYVIKSDAAGGVQEDRLLDFLRAIRKRYQSESLRESFDHKAAMFVCNRWDNIKEGEQEKVKNYILKQLGFVWPDFQPSQTFFFSTRGTEKHVRDDPELVTDSFNSLLMGLKDIFELAKHVSIKQQYVWLKKLIHPASRHLRSMITHCILSNEELEEIFKIVATRQQNLLDTSQPISRALKEKYDQKVQELTSAVSELFSMTDVDPKQSLSDFEEMLGICSGHKFLQDRDNRRCLDKMIVNSLMKYMDDQMMERNTISDLESVMLEAMYEHLGTFKAEIKQIKRSLVSEHRQPPDCQLDPSCGETDTKSINSCSSSGQFDRCGTSIQSDLEETQSSNMDPTRLTSKVHFLLMDRSGSARRRSSHIRINSDAPRSALRKLMDKIKYRDMDPEKYLQERCMKIAHGIRDDEQIMQHIIDDHVEWIKMYLKAVTSSIPKFTAKNTLLMEKIRIHRTTFMRDRDQLKAVMMDLEPSRSRIIGYGALYMKDIKTELVSFITERRASSVVLSSDITTSARRNDDSGFIGSVSKRDKIHGFWTRLIADSMTIDEAEQWVAVKMYTHEIDEALLLTEIASLRCLEHENIATFYGMKRISSSGLHSDTLPAFVFNGNLVSTRVYSLRRTVDNNEWLPGMLTELLQGLNFLHKEKLVHMELNLDTVTVTTESGQVKLCQQCKPRVATLPEDLTNRTKACVCLSPSVLHGSVYEYADDIYAFGLFLWEMLFPDSPPFEKERDMPLRDFIEECHPSTMLRAELEELQMEENVKTILKGTVMVDKSGSNMSISAIQSCLAQGPPVTSKTNRRSRIAIRKSSDSNNASDFADGIPVSSETHVSEGQTHESYSACKDDLLDLALPSMQPTRPPRRKDLLKSHSLHSEDSQTQTSSSIMESDASQSHMTCNANSEIVTAVRRVAKRGSHLSDPRQKRRSSVAGYEITYEMIQNNFQSILSKMDSNRGITADYPYLEDGNRTPLSRHISFKDSDPLNAPRTTTPESKRYHEIRVRNRNTHERPGVVSWVHDDNSNDRERSSSERHRLKTVNEAKERAVSLTCLCWEGNQPFDPDSDPASILSQSPSHVTTDEESKSEVAKHLDRGDDVSLDDSNSSFDFGYGTFSTPQD